MRVRPPAVVGATLGTVAVTLVTGLGSPANAVTTDQTYWVPATKQVTVRGHGYGHGHGMSQWGAKGAAEAGLDWRQIAEFYYPGTTWGFFNGNVRVRISADTSRDVVVSPAAGLTLRDLGNGQTYVLPDIDGVKRWRLNVDGDQNVVGYLTDRWRRWRPGGQAALVGDGQFAADGPLTLWTPSGSATYRGALRMATPSAGSTDRDTVNVLRMDDYVKGVVAREMPASWAADAVRAQAVAARTYATWSRAQHPRRYYQICDTTSCQVYGGVGGEDYRGNAAVVATHGQILTYQGTPAFTQFAASSGGWTAAGGMPYLTAHEDPYDDTPGNYAHDWSTTVDLSRLESAYPRVGTLNSLQVVSRDGNGEWGGRVGTIVLHGSSGDQSISGDAFRWMYGLKTTWFSIDPTPIIARWSRIGGAQSVVGPVSSRERPLLRGTVQVFDRGRIYYHPRWGAHELYGPILDTYLSAGGPADSRVRWPASGVVSRAGGLKATFARGMVYSNDRTGTVMVANPGVVRAYFAAGGVTGELGWATATNRHVPGGERVEFEHGWIDWNWRRSRAYVHLR